MIVVTNNRLNVDDSDNINVVDISESSGYVEVKNRIDSIVLVFDSSVSGMQQDSNLMYRLINRVVSKTEKMALVVTDIYDENAKLLCLLLAKNNRLSIFTVDSIGDIDEDYLLSIEDAAPSISELKEFVGNDIAVYGKVLNIVAELANSTYKSDSTLADTVRNNRENISSIAGIMNVLQSAIDRLNEQLVLNEAVKSGAADSLEQARNIKEIQRLTSLIEDYEREKNVVTNSMMVLKRENDELRSKLDAAESKVGKGIMSDKYLTLNLDKFVNIPEVGKPKPIVKDVIYFKEISPCRFINSFVIMLYRYITHTSNLNCKVVIFDKKGYNNIRYGKLKRYNAGSYEKDKHINAVGDVFVATEAARNIIEDVLMNNSIVIIYDRMNGDDDIISGRNVHRYEVVNGEKEFIELGKVKKVDYSRVITNFGTDKRMISVREVYDYKVMSSSGKLSAYVNMKSTIDVTKSIYSIMLEECKIHID